MALMSSCLHRERTAKDFKPVYDLHQDSSLLTKTCPPDQGEICPGVASGFFLSYIYWDHIGLFL